MGNEKKTSAARSRIPSKAIFVTHTRIYQNQEVTADVHQDSAVWYSTKASATKSSCETHVQLIYNALYSHCYHLYFRIFPWPSASSATYITTNLGSWFAVGADLHPR